MEQEITEKVIFRGEDQQSNSILSAFILCDHCVLLFYPFLAPN